MMGVSDTHSAVRSTSQIDFDAHNDQVIDVVINEHGLGVQSTADHSTQLNVAGNATLSGCLTIGSGSMSSSNLNVQGSVAYGHIAVSANVTADQYNVYLLNTSSEDLTVMLPDASVLGREVRLKKTATANQVFVRSTSGCTLDGSEEMRLLSGNLSSATLFSDGSAWHALEQYSVEFGTSSNTSSSSSTPSLTFHLPFDETDSDTVAEDSGTGLTGAKTNFETSGNGWVAGKINNGLEFDSIDDYVEFANDSSSAIGSSATITFFVKMKSLPFETSVNQVILAQKHGASNKSIWLQVNHWDSKLRATLVDSAGTQTMNDGGTALVVDTWHHVALTVDGTSVTLYLDGVVDGDFTLGAPGLLAADGILRFNGKPDGSLPAHAIIDDFRIYDGPLDSAAINALIP
jgi:hypothetical protein